MKATETFRNPHNCAQAVAAKYRSLYHNQDIVSEYAPYAGGRTPTGECGALYAAKQAMPDKADEIEAEFVAVCGARTCREIKTICRTPCETCVDTADKLLEKYSI